VTPWKFLAPLVLAAVIQVAIILFTPIETMTSRCLVSLSMAAAMVAAFHAGQAWAWRQISRRLSKPNITCPACNMTSYNPNDVKEHYCGNCHAFHPKRSADA